MGTPCACAYAVLFFAYFERTHLRIRYAKNLSIYLRMIDDIFVVWKHNKDEPDAFESFKEDLNKQCKLEWITEDLSKTTNFLDLTIMINHGKIVIKTYHKPINLFLYIPDFSAHPPGLQKSVIYGLLETYWRQNTKKEDFLSTTRFLFQNLIARGCKPDKISTICIEKG